MFKENILVLVQQCNRDSHGAAAFPQESPSLELVPALGPSWATAPAVSASQRQSLRLSRSMQVAPTQVC